jgi:hypothetical protein
VDIPRRRTQRGASLEITPVSLSGPLRRTEQPRLSGLAGGPFSPRHAAAVSGARHEFAVVALGYANRLEVNGVCVLNRFLSGFAFLDDRARKHVGDDWQARRLPLQ